MLGVTGIFAVAGIFKTIAGVPAVINDPNDASAPAVVHFPAIAGFPSNESASAITDFTIVYDIPSVAGGVVGSSLLFLVLLLLLASLQLLAVLTLLQRPCYCRRPCWRPYCCLRLRYCWQKPGISGVANFPADTCEPNIGAVKYQTYQTIGLLLLH